MRLLSIGETAAELGVGVGTLRRRHPQRLLMPACRTIDGHRRYQHDAVQALTGVSPRATGKMLVTKDWLRFGSELLLRIREFSRVEVIVLDAVPYASAGEWGLSI